MLVMLVNEMMLVKMKCETKSPSSVIIYFPLMFFRRTDHIPGWELHGDFISFLTLHLASKKMCVVCGKNWKNKQQFCFPKIFLTLALKFSC